MTASHFTSLPLLLRLQIIDELGQLPGKVRSALLLDGAMKELAQQLAATQSLLFFGRGYNYATALEAALKVRRRASRLCSPSLVQAC